jgi:hypothetical protein
VSCASLSESRMREIRTSWFDERGVETERQPPRHSSTLHGATIDHLD